MPTIFKDKVTIGTVTFNDLATKPATAQFWALDVLEGWKSGPDVDLSLGSIAGVDGEVLGDVQTVRARHLVLSGYVKAATRLDSDQLEDLLVRQAFPRNTDLVLTRYEPVPKFLRVRRAGPIEVSPPMPDGFRFTVDLVAPDPFKYSLSPLNGSAGVAGLSSGGRSYPRTYPLVYTTVVAGDANKATIDNIGTVASAPVFTITGPLTRGGWRLSNETTGNDLFLDIGVAATDSLVVDFGTEIVRLNGFVVNPSVGGDFWRVEPGVNVIKLYGDYTPGAGFTVTTYSAWE